MGYAARFVSALGLLFVFLMAGRGADPKPIRQLGEPRLRHGFPITSIAFSPDSKLLATAGKSLVRLFDSGSGKEVQQLKLENAPLGIAFAPDGKVLAIAAGEKVILWELSADRATELPKLGCSAVVFSPDGKRLAISGTRVTIWDVATGKQTHFLQTTQAPGRALAFSPDGKMVAAGDARSSKEGCARLWNVESGEPIRVISGIESGVTRLAFTPDGKSLLTLSRLSSIQLWDLADGKEMVMVSQGFDHPPLSVPGIPIQEHSLVVSADGKALFSAGPHDRMIQQWKLPKGELAQNFRAPAEGIGCLALSADGQWLAGGGLDGNIRLWNLASSKEQERGSAHPGAVFGLGFSADGRTLYSACTGNALMSWDWAAGKQLTRQQIDFRDSQCLLLGSSHIVTAIRAETIGRSRQDRRLDPDGITRYEKILMVGQRWELATGKPLTDDPASNDGFFGIALSPDRRSLQTVSASSDPAQAEMMSGFNLEKPRAAIGWLPGGMKCLIQDHILAARESKALATRESKMARQSPDEVDESLYQRLAELAKIQRARSVSWAVVSADGRTWARLDPSADTASPNLKIQEAGTGITLAELTAGPPTYGRGLPLRDVIAFSPDGRWIAFPRADGELAVHNVATGKEEIVIRHGQGATTSVAFSPEGKALASGGLDGSIRLWDISKLRAVPAEISDRELAACWDQLRWQDAGAARQAMWKLMDAPQRSLPLLRKLLLPRNPAAAEQLDRLVADLDSNNFDVREKAAEELERLGILSEDRLRQVLKGNPTLEVRTRIEAILRRQPKPRLSDEDRRSMRAVAVLEYIGSDEAHKHLEELAAGHERVRLTQEAKVVLERWQASKGR